MEYDTPFTKIEVSTPQSRTEIREDNTLNVISKVRNREHLITSGGPVGAQIKPTRAKNDFKDKINKNIVTIGEQLDMTGPVPSFKSFDIVTSTPRFQNFHGDNINNASSSVLSETDSVALSSQELGLQNNNEERTARNGLIAVGQFLGYDGHTVNIPCLLHDADSQSKLANGDGTNDHGNMQYRLSNIGLSKTNHQNYFQHFETNHARSCPEDTTWINEHQENWQHFKPNEDKKISDKTSIDKKTHPRQWQNSRSSVRAGNVSTKTQMDKGKLLKSWQTFDDNNYVPNKSGFKDESPQQHWLQFEPDDDSNLNAAKRDTENEILREDWQNLEQNKIHRYSTVNSGIKKAAHREHLKKFQTNEDKNHSLGKAVTYNERSKGDWERFEPIEDNIKATLSNLCTVPNVNFRKNFSDSYIVSVHAQERSENEGKRSTEHFESTDSIDSNSSINSDRNSISNYMESMFSSSEIASHFDKTAVRLSTGVISKTEARQRSQVKFRKETQSDGADHELIINANSLMHNTDETSVHLYVYNTATDSQTSISKFNSKKIGGYNQNKQSPFLYVNSNKDTNNSLTQRLPHLTSNKHHHVDKNVIDTQNREAFFHKSIPTSIKKKVFSQSYGAPFSSGMPEESNFKKMINSQSEFIHMNKAFRTHSSASLNSDNSLVEYSSVPSSRDTYKKLFKLRNFFSSKRGNTVVTPLDDAMDFGIQDSTLSSDESQSGHVESINKDEDKKKSIPKDELIEKAEPDTTSETRTAVYKRRWYLLFLFSVSAMLWNAVWSTWGPIAQSAKLVYDWTDADIAMFIWLGNIPFLITMFPSSYLMDVSGMRLAMIAACIFMFLGTGFRCIPGDITTSTWLIRVGQFLNGMAGTIPNSGPALLSALWFPPNQRASATAISTVAGYMGASISFIIGPLVVTEPPSSPVNNTNYDLSADSFPVINNSLNNNNTNTSDYDTQKNGIMTILYAEFGVAGLLLLLVLIYFPSKPPLPPSISASIPREKYIKGLKTLIRNKQFWVCAIAFSLPVGVYESWQVILDVILNDYGISQQTAGWLDFYATLGGCISGLLVSRFADFFTRQMKLFLLIFYFIATFAILWFILLVLDILPLDDISIYAAIIIAGVFLDGGGPLFFELTIEVSYPVGEGVTSGFTQMLCAAAGLVFLSLAQVEALGKQWMNWCFFGCVAIAIPLLFFIKTTYGRADIDDMDSDESDDDDTTASHDAINSSDKEQLVT